MWATWLGNSAFVDVGTAAVDELISRWAIALITSNEISASTRQARVDRSSTFIDRRTADASAVGEADRTHAEVASLKITAVTWITRTDRTSTLIDVNAKLPVF